MGGQFPQGKAISSAADQSTLMHSSGTVGGEEISAGGKQAVTVVT